MALFGNQATTPLVEDDEEMVQCQRAAFEQAIASGTGDIVQIWCDYVRWAEAQSPRSGGGEATLLARACGVLAGDPSHNGDIRHLRLWVRHASELAKPQGVFEVLEAHSIGVGHALLYEAWATSLERQHRFSEASVIYRRGLDRNAEPIMRLHNRSIEFEQRMQQRAARRRGRRASDKADETDARPAPRPGSMPMESPSATISGCCRTFDEVEESDARTAPRPGSMPMESSNRTSTRGCRMFDEVEEFDMRAAPRPGSMPMENSNATISQGCRTFDEVEDSGTRPALRPAQMPHEDSSATNSQGHQMFDEVEQLDTKPAPMHNEDSSGTTSQEPWCQLWNSLSARVELRDVASSSPRAAKLAKTQEMPNDALSPLPTMAPKASPSKLFIATETQSCTAKQSSSQHLTMGENLDHDPSCVPTPARNASPSLKSCAAREIQNQVENSCWDEEEQENIQELKEKNEDISVEEIQAERVLARYKPAHHDTFPLPGVCTNAVGSSVFSAAEDAKEIARGNAPRKLAIPACKGDGIPKFGRFSHRGYVC